MVLVGDAGVFLTYVRIKRLSGKDFSGELFDPGSTSDLITKSGEILPPPHSELSPCDPGAQRHRRRAKNLCTRVGQKLKHQINLPT